VFISWLPVYLKDVLGYDMNSIGMVLSCIPYLVQPLISVLTGILADTLIKKEIVSLLAVRKFFQGATCFLASSCLVVLSFADLVPVWRMILVLSVVSLFGFALGAGYTCNFLDLTGTHAAATMAVSNTLATVPGIVGVYLTGFLKEKTGDYQAAFLLAAGIYVLGLYSYMIWASVNQIDFENRGDRAPLLNDKISKRHVEEE